jgi:release factor glutamine methyltransferase
MMSTIRSALEQGARTLANPINRDTTQEAHILESSKRVPSPSINSGSLDQSGSSSSTPANSVAFPRSMGKIHERTNAMLDAQVLLAHVLNVDRVTLYTYPERLLTPEQEQQFHVLIERRERGEPVAYLIGHKEFYGLDFLVDRRVLIPRPETELVVESALDVIRSMLNTGRVPIVADIGTGSGAIPITLAAQEPHLPYLYATDISTEALDVARLNAELHHVERRIKLLQGDLLAPLPEPVDLLIANLPYVGTTEIDMIAPDVRDYEPHLALFSGPYGLDLLRRLLTDAKQSDILVGSGLAPVLILEIGYQQREPLLALINKLWPRANVTFKQDYAGWDRVVRISLPT